MEFTDRTEQRRCNAYLVWFENNTYRVPVWFVSVFSLEFGLSSVTFPSLITASDKAALSGAWSINATLQYCVSQSVVWRSVMFGVLWCFLIHDTTKVTGLQCLHFAWLCVLVGVRPQWRCMTFFPDAPLPLVPQPPPRPSQFYYDLVYNPIPNQPCP